MSSIEQLIRQRRTIHDFEPEPIDQSIVTQALDTAVWAPNHKLSEPWRFYHIGPETKQAICQLNATLVTEKKGKEAGQKKLHRWMGIPGWLAVTCIQSSDPLRRQEDYAACCCVIHNLSLLLWDQGIGMKWSTGPVTRDARFYDLIWADPQREKVVSLIWYGKPAKTPTPGRKPAETFTVNLD